MKQFFACLLATAFIAAEALAAKQSPVTGTVEDEKGEPVAYATVVAMKENVQIAGTTTDEKGAFRLNVTDGEYDIIIEFLGYEPINRHVSINGVSNLGIFSMKSSSVKIEGVEVKAQIIRREADRFVVDVANMPSSIGKDGVELLEASPGVFVNDDKISIYGKSGAKVYVNDRELKYSDEQLLNYLRNLKNDDVQKIEIIPQSGADYDADSAGGIIKITLKRKRDNGLMGTVSFNTRQGDLQHSYNPSLNLNYNSGKWNINASGWYSNNAMKFQSDENTQYSVNSNRLQAETTQRANGQWYGGRFGAIYDINDRHSIGAEIEYYGSQFGTDTESGTLFENADPAYISNNDSRYNSSNPSNSVTATLNYIVKLDTLGSRFKLLADYTLSKSNTHNDYLTKRSLTYDYGSGPVILPDSVYRDRSGTDYNVTTVDLSYEKVFSPKIILRTGGKYTNNIMASNAFYEQQDNDTGIWNPRDDGYNYDINYVEHIGALYAIADAKLGRWGLSAGLRGEYTHTSGRHNVARQSYFSLFPNANVSFAMKKDGSYSMVLQYARKIRRPSFWALNPERQQISDYTYQIGNPNLDPQFSNDISMTFVMKYKYSLTLGAQFQKDEIQQIARIDEDNPNISYLTTENLDRTSLYYASLSLPFQFTKWWSMNINGTAMYYGTRIAKNSPQQYHFMWYANATTTFTLPKQFYIDLSCYGSSNMYVSNISVKGTVSLNASLKKRFFEDRLTLSAGVRNIIPQKMRFTFNGDEFTRTVSSRQAWGQPMFTFSASYTFNKGKKFQQRSIESGADTSRLAKEN